MANIDSAFSSEFLSINDNVLIANGSSNPSTGIGFEAPMGSIYLRTGIGEVYVKFGSADIDWSLVKTGITNLDDLGDVVLTSPATGNTLVFNGTNWTNQAVAGTTDQLVKITSADTTANYLQPKLIAGTNISITKNNPGANETLTISSTGIISSDEKVKVSITDTSAGFLLDKLVAGTNITLTQISPGANESTAISVTGLTSSSVGLGNVTNNLQVINAGGAVSIQEDILANRPTFGSIGRLFLDIGTNILYRDTGVSWVPIGNMGTVTSISAIAPVSGITITGSPITSSGTLTFALADDLAALEAISSPGFITRTGTNTWSNRSISGSGQGISVINGDGTIGNPTISLTNDIAAIEALTTNGILVRTGLDTWTMRSMIGPSSGISIVNGDGISGNPTLSLINDLGAIEALSGTGLARRTGTDTWSLGGVVSLAEGGTGQITANAALNALLPSQIGNTGKVITTDGTNTSWASVITTDQYLRISGTDTTSDFLQTKLVAGSGISLVKSIAGNETLTINSTSVIPGDQACIQLTRTTTFTTTAAWQDVLFSSADVLNNAAILNWTSGANITVNQSGPYQIFYKVPQFGTTAATKIVQARIRKNATTIISGSSSYARGASSNDIIDVSDTFVAILNAGDTIQLQITNSANQTAGVGIMMGLVKLSASIGPQGLAGNTGANGAPGSGSTINVLDEGTTLSGSPFSNLNFIGAGVIATPGAGGIVNVSIPGGTAILKSFVYYPASLDNPINASWIVNSIAPMISDPAYGAFNVRRFNNITEQGIGCYLTVPPGANNVTVKFKGRAQTAVGADSIVQPRLYIKAIPNNATVGSWLSPIEMTNLAVPNDAVFHYYQQTLSLSIVNMVSSGLYQLEVTRRTSGLTGGTNLSSDWLMIELSFDFT